jgi:Uma2 family endonuclease
MSEVIFPEPYTGAQRHLSEYEIERNKPMPNKIHALLESALNWLLRGQYGSQFQILTELSLDTTPVVTPDLCIYPKFDQKFDPRTVTARESQMPLTAIEILSPSQTLDQLQSKAWNIYFPAGVRSVWIVVPELKVIQLLLPDGEPKIFHKNTLDDPATGISLSVEQVFEDLV